MSRYIFAYAFYLQALTQTHPTVALARTQTLSPHFQIPSTLRPGLTLPKPAPSSTSNPKTQHSKLPYDSGPPHYIIHLPQPL